MKIKAVIIDKQELTECESVILRFLCEGYLRKQIADKLHRSIKTVDNHCGNMQRKLEAKNSTHAATIAVAKGIVKVSVIRNIFMSSFL